MGIIGLIALAVLAVYAVMVYNSLVTLKNGVAKAWANIEVLLKQRHEELPKLVDTCKQYMKHEQETLDKVIQARAGVSSARQLHDLGALGAAENALRGSLGQLFALAESYPELKADGQFLHLQSRISGLENAIADRREFYNESVNLNNVGIAQFPPVLIAQLFKFKPFDLLKFSSEEIKDVDIGQRFST